MSFSKSKVERFPNSNPRAIRSPISKANKIAGSGILKRSYLLLSPSTSMMPSPGSSFHSTPSKKDNLKQRRPLKDEGKYGQVSNTTGNKKSPIPRIPVLNRSHNRTVITKPKCSPVYRGKVLNMTGMKTNQTTPGKRKQLLTSGSKKTSTSRKKDSMPTPKRKKFDETSDDNYLTPLTSPPDSNSNSNQSTNIADASSSTIIFDPQSLSRCLEEAKNTRKIEDQDEVFTPTAPFESTRLDVDVTPIQPPESATLTEILNGGDSSENILDDVAISDKEEEEATVTTPRRNSSRKSVPKQNLSFIEASSANRSVGAASSFTLDNLTFPDDEHTSRISEASRAQQYGSGSGPYDFTQIHQLSEVSERIRLLFEGSALASNPQAGVMLASDDLHLGLSGTDFQRDSDSDRPRAQSFSCYRIYDSPGLGQVTGVEYEEPIPPSKPTSISSRIGTLLSTMFPKKTKREHVRSAGRSQIFAEHNYVDLQQVRDVSRSNMRRRPRRLATNSFIPAAFREFIFREPPSQARFDIEVLRRLARMIRIETMHTFREIRVSIVLPAKMYVKSPEFWMPVLEFVAGQALEITLTSLRK